LIFSHNTSQGDVVYCVQVGVAFTRYQTRFFQGKYGNLDANVISYGPCQTPTLNFAVEQHQRIVNFVPELYWAVAVSCTRSSGHRISLQWSRGRVFKQDVGQLLRARVWRPPFMRSLPLMLLLV
jgi:DNA topoisomerase-3